MCRGRVGRPAHRARAHRPLLKVLESVCSAQQTWSHRYKPFSSSMKTRENKLECLCLARLFSPALHFEVRLEPAQVEHLSSASLLGRLLALSPNISLCERDSPWKNALAYSSETSATEPTKVL
jgi:hypothetical protein